MDVMPYLDEVCSPFHSCSCKMFFSCVFVMIFLNVTDVT